MFNFLRLCLPHCSHYCSRLSEKLLFFLLHCPFHFCIHIDPRVFNDLHFFILHGLTFFVVVLYSFIYAQKVFKIDQLVFSRAFHNLKSLRIIHEHTLRPHRSIRPVKLVSRLRFWFGRKRISQFIWFLEVVSCSDH